MSSSLLGNNNEQFLHRIVMCDEKWILCNNQRWPAQWLDWEEAPKDFTKPNLHYKESWSLFGGLSLVWSTTVSESRRNHYIREVFSANWWDTLKTVMPEAGIVQQKGPSSFPWQLLTTHHTTNASKIEWIRLWNFASSAIFTWSLANWPALLQASQQLFAGKKLLQTTGGRKCLLRVCRLLKHEFLCYGNK